MRREKDALGELLVPDDAYYGIQTVRCAQNHNVTDHTFEELPQVIRALAEIKKACAMTNAKIGALEEHKAQAIVEACNEVIEGRFNDQFPINIWRSHGTGANMNANEVIANRANEILTGHKGYDQIHPNTHVNMCQSSNDVYPTVQSIVLFRMIGEALESIKDLESALGEKAKEFQHVVRLGRTCLQDAVPNTFGQVFGGWQHMMYRNRRKLESYRDEYREVVLGATVLGTGMGQMPGYSERIMSNLSNVVGFEVRWPTWNDEVIQDSAVFDGMQNCDHNMVLGGLLKAITCGAARICSDLCILSSGPRSGFGEIKLPHVFTGPASIGGDDYPYIPDMIYQIMQQSIIADHVATLTVNENDSDEAITDGASFMGSIETLENITKGFRLFSDQCIRGITVNQERVQENAEMSTSLATMVSALFGYPIGTKIAQKAYREGISCKSAALEDKLLNPEVAEELFDLQKLTDREAMVEMFRRCGQLRHID
ncbi:MAG TPA: lyase [Candidatus Aphodousia gallistercoris]|nr:lyase [Candidatus Aphodousia gallistercoris]